TRQGAARTCAVAARCASEPLEYVNALARGCCQTVPKPANGPNDVASEAELAMVRPSESTTSMRSVVPPIVVCESTESSAATVNLTLTTPTFAPRSRMDSASSITGTLVAASTTAVAWVAPVASERQAVRHHASSLWTKSPGGELATAL